VLVVDWVQPWSDRSMGHKAEKNRADVQFRTGIYLLIYFTILCMQSQ